MLIEKKRNYFPYMWSYLINTEKQEILGGKFRLILLNQRGREMLFEMLLIPLIQKNKVKLFISTWKILLLIQNNRTFFFPQVTALRFRTFSTLHVWKKNWVLKWGIMPQYSNCYKVYNVLLTRKELICIETLVLMPSTHTFMSSINICQAVCVFSVATCTHTKVCLVEAQHIITFTLDYFWTNNGSLCSFCVAFFLELGCNNSIGNCSICVCVCACVC